jgi:hypothetical protein
MLDYWALSQNIDVNRKWMVFYIRDEIHDI